MRKIIVICFCLLSFVTFSQKVFKEYYPNFHVKYEYQIDGSGVKNGFFKSYSTIDQLYESGFYSQGKKSGTWTTYGIIQGHPSEVASTMEYRDDKMNGKYIQYCWSGGKRYMCSDYTYIDDQDVAAEKYYANGRLSEKYDVKKGIHEQWFEDGSPHLVMQGNRLYEFDQDEWGRRSVSHIYFDSTDFLVQLIYHGYNNSLSHISFCKKDSTGKLNGYHEVLTRFGYNDFASIEILKGHKVQKMDSVNYRQCFELYCNAPNPNGTNRNCPYDFLLGNIIDPEGRYIRHPHPEGGFTFEEFYEKGVLQKRVLRDGVVQWFEGGILVSEDGPKQDWLKIYNSQGILTEKISKESKGDYKIKYNDQGKLIGEFGYINGKNRAPVNRCYYDSGRLKWDVKLNQKDSISWPEWIYQFADNDSSQVIGLIKIYGKSNDHIGESITKKSDVERIIIEEYRFRTVKILKVINDALYRDGVYLKSELIYDKISRITFDDNYLIRNSSDFKSVETAYKRLLVIQNNLDVIKIPVTKEDERSLKKAKEPDEVLFLLGIPK